MNNQYSHFPNQRSFWIAILAVINKPLRASFVNVCKVTRREPPRMELLGHFRSSSNLGSGRNCQIALQSVLAIYRPLAMIRVPVPPRSGQRLVSSDSSTFVRWWVWNGISLWLYFACPRLLSGCALPHASLTTRVSPGWELVLCLFFYWAIYFWFVCLLYRHHQDAIKTFSCAF